MKKTWFKRENLRRALLAAVAAASVLALAACGQGKAASATDIPAAQAASGTDVQAEVVTVGKGETAFDFEVTDTEGAVVRFVVNTEQEKVGAALIEAGVIEGEDGPYGLYVKTVNGVTLDYDRDGKYWAFYINGEYAASGVDQTEIKAGETYAFKAE